MMVRPACIGFSKAKQIDVEALNALEVVFVVFGSGSVSKTFHVLEEKTDRAGDFLVDGIAV